MAIEMVPVISSNIAKVGYDEGTKELFVQFTSGQVYKYKGVSSAAYAGLLGAESKGRHFHQHIRSTYTYERVEE